MSYSEYIDHIIFLINLITREETGAPGQLAEKLNVSKRTIFRYLGELRGKGAKIRFSREKNTYILENKFIFPKDFYKVL